MSLREWLVAGFEYEIWADERWLRSYPEMPEPRHAEEILAHMLWAMETWLSRVEPSCAIEAKPFEARLKHAFACWIEAVSKRSLDEVIHYSNTSGARHKRQFGAIALYVINHGTYHRGQLRGLAAEQGFEEFPETDLISFLIERNLFGES